MVMMNFYHIRYGKPWAMFSRYADTDGSVDRRVSNSFDTAKVTCNLASSEKCSEKLLSIDCPLLYACRVLIVCENNRLTGQPFHRSVIG